MSNQHRLTLTFSLLTLMSPLAIGQSSNDAGNWKTWILPNATSIAVPPPPSASSTATELAWLKGFQSSADAAVSSQIKYWDAGAPAFRWVDFVTLRHLANRPIGAPDVNRPYAYVAIAVYDATVAAFNAKYKYNRKRPSEQDPTIIPRVSVPASPSYPSDYAAAAGAASVVLAYFLPEEADSIQLLAEEAGRSRLSAGVEFPSDYIADFELGRRVGEQIVARAKADGSGGVFNGTIPTGRCNWTGTNPGNFTAQFWKPFLLTSAREFRPVPPPACDSPQVQADLAAVRNFPRALTSANLITNSKALHYQTPDGVQPWPFVYLNRLVLEDRLDAPAAARAYALLGAAMYDVWIASQDGKYTYWYLRPAQLDPTLVTLFAAPNFPSYPSNHSSFSALGAEIIAYLFPREANPVRAKALDAGNSRIYAGIHYEMDNQAGFKLGRDVAAKFIAFAEADGSK